MSTTGASPTTTAPENSGCTASPAHCNHVIVERGVQGGLMLPSTDDSTCSSSPMTTVSTPLENVREHDSESLSPEGASPGCAGNDGGQLAGPRPVDSLEGHPTITNGASPSPRARRSHARANRTCSGGSSPFNSLTSSSRASQLSVLDSEPSDIGLESRIFWKSESPPATPVEKPSLETGVEPRPSHSRTRSAGTSGSIFHEVFDNPPVDLSINVQAPSTDSHVPSASTPLVASRRQDHKLGAAAEGDDPMTDSEPPSTSSTLALTIRPQPEQHEETSGKSMFSRLTKPSWLKIGPQADYHAPEVDPAKFGFESPSSPDSRKSLLPFNFRFMSPNRPSFDNLLPTPTASPCSPSFDSAVCQSSISTPSPFRLSQPLICPTTGGSLPQEKAALITNVADTKSRSLLQGATVLRSGVGATSTPVKWRTSTLPTKISEEKLEFDSFDGSPLPKASKDIDREIDAFFSASHPKRTQGTSLSTRSQRTATVSSRRVYSDHLHQSPIPSLVVSSSPDTPVDPFSPISSVSPLFLSTSPDSSPLRAKTIVSPSPQLAPMRPASSRFENQTATKYPESSPSIFERVHPAEALFYLGFALGPWCWIIGGWLLESDGLIPLVDREGQIIRAHRGCRCTAKSCPGGDNSEKLPQSPQRLDAHLLPANRVPHPPLHPGSFGRGSHPRSSWSSFLTPYGSVDLGTRRPAPRSGTPSTLVQAPHSRQNGSSIYETSEWGAEIPKPRARTGMGNSHNSADRRRPVCMWVSRCRQMALISGVVIVVLIIIAVVVGIRRSHN
ncbi:hypothetical protein BOTBODRAFT_59945 [Botryobasidium botryosum FD-172 SS1]|uniref:Uncharacterized protein n=1 Tax=Botryobasidium botryosum (strain FD-172 SS1) TaxID=930990 RepID=A0A067LWI5_BOTB1|nr:hypothetical protein BOTBODRAFT_59945 [Botryobasidium botryosum FD-172 SS1]